MKNKRVSLLNLISLKDNEQLSETYVKYIAGLEKEDQYRHQEIIDISNLLSELNLREVFLSGFIYSYKIALLNKEFDLLKITSKRCINIKLKSELVALSKMQKQLKQNVHYLRMLDKEIYTFTFISSSKSLYKLNDSNVIEPCDINTLKELLKDISVDEIDLDNVFIPKNILVSPLNSPEEFVNNKYILTENQQVIKEKIISYIQNNNKKERFIGITGGPGTGKTLLVYDIAKELSKKSDVLIIHSGIKCDGHDYLNNNIKKLKIIEAKEIRYREFKGTDFVVVDESHRLYTSTIDSIIKWVTKSKTTCIFSYDASQKLSKYEVMINNAEKIQNKCGTSNIFKLTNKIRTNKELALFIDCLFDLSKFRSEYSFKNVEIIYEPDEKKAVTIAQNKIDYTYISYTPSKYFSNLDYQKHRLTTHKVIGQEFDNVVMIINSYFEYDGNKLKSKEHPNPDYIFVQLLFQGLTRSRNKLFLIITRKDTLIKILTLFNK